MNITLLMNETEPISCQSVNVIPDNIDDYTNLSSVQYVHKHNTNSNNNNIISNTNNHNILSTNHKSNPNGNTNELSTTDYTNTRDNLNSSSNCTSPNNSILTMYGTQHRFKISPNTYHDVENGNNLSTMSISTRPDTDVDSAFPPKKLYTDDIPVLESFPGFYGFDLYRPLCGDTYEASETKPSTAFFYFKDEQGWTNLYAKKTPTWWTLSYWCQRKPPDGSFIRLTPVYGASDKQQEVIQRCFEDFMAIPTIGMGRYSIVMVGNSLAEYFFDPITERLCVTLPYETPKEGCEYSQFNGKFMCFNSCLYNGGQGNKKPLFLIITLEHLITGSDPSKGHCEVLGRQCIKFRSCACPKRDKENNERRTGDSMVIGTPSLGKRRKELHDRNDRQVKRIRSNQRPSSVCNMNSITNTSIHNGNGVNYEKDTNQLREQNWSSPSHEYLLNDEKCPSEPNGADDLFDYYGQEYDFEAYGQNTIHFNGESYNLLLVPTNLPGAVETLSSVRYGLLRAWIYSLANHHYHHHNQQYYSMMMKQSPLTSDLNARKDIKSDTNINSHTSSLNTTNSVNNNVMVGKSITEKRSDTSDSRYYPAMSGNYSNSYNRAVIGSTLNHWLKTESHLAAMVRERINLLTMCHQTYHFSGDSTDSQPNSTLSTGAIGFNGTGNLDEPVNILNQDYFNSSNMNTSVGNELMNSNLTHNLSNHQTNIMQNMAAYILSSTSTTTVTSTTTTATSTNSVNNRGFTYNTTNTIDSNWSYETDPDLRSGQASHTEQLYESTHQGLIIGNNNNNSNNTVHVVSDLVDPYALVQHLPHSLSSSSPVHQHHHIHSHHQHSTHVHSQHNHQIHITQGMDNSNSLSNTNDNHLSAFTTTALISDNTMNTKSLTPQTCVLPQITPTTSTTVTETGTKGVKNFGHDFNTSNFYTSAYFNLANSNANTDSNNNNNNNNNLVINCTNDNQSNDIADQNSTLIDSLTRSNIPLNSNRNISQNSTLCNYQLIGHTNLSESLLLSEELLHNCLDNKKKCYDESGGVHSILTKHLVS
ncbi:Cellular tumor antigen p53 [Schistosoma japonicum]|nr:Cellular tumor antigen p53 [Schistosoma japonicum]